jgi:catechol 2,3-dioxygenase-like lactoylglutathione lyase family enzyme
MLGSRQHAVSYGSTGAHAPRQARKYLPVAMFDHVQLKVEDFESSRVFYEAVLGALGYTVVFKAGGVVGIGINPHDMFEVRQASPSAAVSKAAHIAFAAKSEDAVYAFHAAALARGAKDNGVPGLRPQYEQGYFAAFVIDPNGHNLEAVFKKG